jgi:ectoine hydroxylase-related dioxygenase (phytanoyl-CoA dioxygenase family)
VVHGYLSAGECELLKKRLTPILSDYKPVAGSERSILDRHLMHDLLCRDLAFARLLEDPRLQQLFAPSLGPYWVLYAFTSSSIPPNDVNYSGRLHVDSPRWVPQYPFNMGIIWNLDDYTELNGAVKVLPGSQHSDETPGEDLFERNCVRVTCPRGSAIVFDARLFHRTDLNQTQAWRHSLTMNVCRPFMKQRIDWVRFVPRAIADALNPQARRILGFDTRLPTSLEELFVPEQDRLYKPNQG